MQSNTQDTSMNKKSAWRDTVEHCEQNPMTGVVAATGAIVGSFALVLSGIGGIHLVMQ